MKSETKTKWIELDDGVRIKVKALLSSAKQDSFAFKVVGWKGFEENGKPLTYTRLEAKRMLKECPLIATSLQESIEGYFKEA